MLLQAELGHTSQGEFSSFLDTESHVVEASPHKRLHNRSGDTPAGSTGIVVSLMCSIW